MALAADAYLERGDGHQTTLTANGAVSWFRGSVLTVEGGYLAKPGAAALTRPIGVAQAAGSNAAGENRRVPVFTGLVRVAHAAAAQTDVGKNAHWTDDETLVLRAPTNALDADVLGEVPVVDYEAGYLWVDFRMAPWGTR